MEINARNLDKPNFWTRTWEIEFEIQVLQPTCLSVQWGKAVLPQVQALTDCRSISIRYMCTTKLGNIRWSVLFSHLLCENQQWMWNSFPCLLRGIHKAFCRSIQGWDCEHQPGQVLKPYCCTADVGGLVSVSVFYWNVNIVGSWVITAEAENHDWG